MISSENDDFNYRIKGVRHILFKKEGDGK